MQICIVRFALEGKCCMSIWWSSSPLLSRAQFRTLQPQSTGTSLPCSDMTHHLRILHAESVHEKVTHTHTRKSPCQLNTLLQAEDDSDLIIQAEISDMQHDLVLCYSKRTFGLLQICSSQRVITQAKWQAMFTEKTKKGEGNKWNEPLCHFNIRCILFKTAALDRYCYGHPSQVKTPYIQLWIIILGLFLSTLIR